MKMLKEEEIMDLMQYGMHFITYLELFSKEWDSQVINMDWYLFI
jgi:hypothetical protein